MFQTVNVSERHLIEELHQTEMCYYFHHQSYFPVLLRYLSVGFDCFCCALVSKN